MVWKSYSYILDGRYIHVLNRLYIIKALFGRAPSEKQALLQRSQNGSGSYLFNKKTALYTKPFASALSKEKEKETEPAGAKEEPHQTGPK